MKIAIHLLTWCGVLTLASSAIAQNQLQIVINGSCYTTDSKGHIALTQINNHSLIKSFADSHGVSDLSGLALAYHLGGNELGDTIEVINRTNGASVYTIFGLYFGEDFGRTALLSKSGQQMKRLEYIYTDQNSHSLGSALLTDYYFLDNSGNTNRTYVLGQMQYIVTPDSGHTNTQVCTANFTTLRPWRFSK